MSDNIATARSLHERFALEMCDDNDNGFFQFFAGSLNLQPEKAAELLLRFGVPSENGQ